MDYLSTTGESATADYAKDSIGLLNKANFFQPTIHPAEYNAFLSLMLSTIDINELCENYFQYLAAKLPLVGLSFAVPESTFVYGDVSRQRFSISLSTSIGDEQPTHIASAINYAFTRRIRNAEQQLLHEFHTHFCAPLSHALSYRLLKSQAIKDSLTGLSNRAAFDEQLSRMMSSFKRQAISFGLLVIDLDNFKQVNDCKGHQTGDKVLIAFAEQIQATLREVDLPYRFGGDEFCCLINDVDFLQLEIIANRICAEIATNPVLKAHGVTSSIGGALVNRGDSAEILFERADSGIYEVKARGKNGVYIAF